MKGWLRPFAGRGLRALWEDMTLPGADRAEPALWRDRLMTDILLALTFIGAVVVGLTAIFVPSYLPASLMGWVSVIGSYLLARLGRPTLAILLTVGSILFVPLFRVLTDAGTTTILPFMIVAILVSSLALPPRFTGVLALLSVVAVLGLPLVQPAVNSNDVFNAAIFIAIVSFLVLISDAVRRYYQRDLERQTRRAAENELRYRLIADSATDMIARHTLEGLYLYVSPASRRLLGYTPDELTGRTIYDLIHPDDLEEFRRQQADILEQSSITTTTYRIRRKNGDAVWFETTSRLVRATVTGHVHEITTVSRDVTGRKMMENALRNSEARFKAAAEGSLDAFIMLTSDRDENGRIADFVFQYVNENAARLVNMERNHMIGARLCELLPVNRTKGYFNNYVKVVETGEPLDEEVHFTDDDGESRWLHHQVVPVGDGIAITTRDMTERKKTESQRLELAVQRERVQMLQHLISDTTHDLKTPLATLNTSLFLLQKSAGDPDRRERYAEALQTQVATLAKILDDMVSISRLDGDTEVFSFHCHDLNDFLAQVVEGHEALAAEKDLILTFRPHHAGVSVSLDTSKFNRAMTNLIANAIHYTESGGTITVTVGATDRQAVVEVRDTGVGIRPESLPRIFDRFYRDDETRHLDSSGSGLGLAIAKKIVEAHSGAIEVESQRGAGSVFRVCLPLTACDEAAGSGA